MKLYVCYPDPLDAFVTLTSDDGSTGSGLPYIGDTGRQGQVVLLDDGIPNGNGGTLELTAPGKIPERLRGFLMLEGDSEIRFQVDDIVMKDAGDEPDPPKPDPNPNANPVDIINGVYNTTHPNLATHAGCGKFTEDCCKALHEQMHPAWGHIKKNPGQNQFNGHAVDAVQLMVTSGDTQPGIYDIIQDSVSSNARPVFNYVEPPKPELYLYPPAPLTKAAVLMETNEKAQHLGY